MIDRNMYGSCKGRKLPAASYKLAEKLENGRGVYSFCMCPGGYVVNASSEEGRLAVNGMSYHEQRRRKCQQRDYCRQLRRQDFRSTHPLARNRVSSVNWRKRPGAAGNGEVPVQRLEDYLLNRKSSAFGDDTAEHERQLYPGRCPPNFSGRAGVVAGRRNLQDGKENSRFR